MLSLYMIGVTELGIKWRGRVGGGGGEAAWKIEDYERN
jgi:hypothetical protein